MPDSGSRWMFPSGGGSGRHLPRTWQPPLPPVPRTRSGGGRGSPRRSSRSGRRFRVQQPDAFSPRPGSRKDPSRRLKRWPEGRSDPFYVPLYSGSNACPGRLRPAPRLGKGDPLPPLALTRFLSRPRGGTELRWHPGLPEAHQPWPVSHIHRLSDSVPVTVQAPGGSPPASVFPKGHARARSCWPPAWGPGLGWGILGAWPSERGSHTSLAHSSFLVTLLIIY